MLQYREPSREIEVVAQVDVLVIGAGPAGVAAAISAGRKGAKTMLIEQSGSVGGVATIGLMSHWTGYTKGGIYEEILDRSMDNPDLRRTINPEKLKTSLLEMLLEANVQIKLYTFAADAIIKDSTIKGVIIESKSGRQACYAKVVIDASGDGDVAARAGAPYIKGRETDGKMQPVTLMFKVANVDTDRAVFPGSFESCIEIPKGEIQALGRKNIPEPAGHVLLYRTTLPGVVTCNMTNCIGIDGTDADDLTKGEIVCRGQIDTIVKFLREYVPGFEECFLISVASFLGVRETRHFKGEKTITEQDISEARVFDDWAVTKAHFNFDVHNITGNGLDKTGCQEHFKQPEGYTIPYGCLVPLKVENLLLAGRNISGTHIAHSNYRAMPICANMGQAAGIAAAICAQTGVAPRALDVALLQAELGKFGVSV